MTSPPESAAPSQESIRDVPRLPPSEEPASDLRDPALYVNRELSWLDFNDRVLQLAEEALVQSPARHDDDRRAAGLHDRAVLRHDGRQPDNPELAPGPDKSRPGRGVG